MTLFDLAIKNIRRNLKSYTLYISSIVFTIAIYFTFVSLQHSDEVMSAAGAMTKIDTLMSMSSILLLIFAAIFIAYSNTFFLKKRKKEVGLYLLLGIRKRKIGTLLFAENVVIGLFALVVGIVAGYIVSGMMLQVLVKLMGFTISGGILFSFEALKNTAIVFFILFLFTSFQGYRVIYKFKLIDLFHAVKKGEQPSKPSLLITLVGILLLVIAYYFASADMFTSRAWKIVGFAMPFIILLSTILGTYLLFHTVLVFVLIQLKKNRRWAWRGLNMMTVSQMLYRIRSNAKTLTVIAVLSATTITAGGAIFGLYYNVERDAASYTPNTFMWEGDEVNVQSDEILMHTAIQVKPLEASQGSSSYQYSVMPQSMYNELAKFHGKAEVQLERQHVYIADPYLEARFGDEIKSSQLILNNLELDVQGYTEQLVVNSNLIYLTAVVHDEFYQELKVEPTTYQIINTSDEKNQLALSKQLEEQLDDTQLSSFPRSYHETLQSVGALLFVGSFLGLVFLVATGSIIYFKMMTEAEEDKDKYEGLNKIGVSFKEMKRTIRAQVAIIFAGPLVLAIMHAGFALTTFSNLFMLNIVEPVLIWMIVYSSVYTAYYVLTIKYYTHTIKRQIAKVGQ